jgi:hypothetical protein
MLVNANNGFTKSVPYWTKQGEKMFSDYKFPTTPVEFFNSLEIAQKQFFDSLEAGVKQWRTVTEKQFEMANVTKK